MSTAPNTRADRIAVVDDDARIRDLLRRYHEQGRLEDAARRRGSSVGRRFHGRDVPLHLVQ